MELKNLDFKTAGFWPTKIKVVAYGVVFVAVLGLAWLAWFSSEMSTLSGLEQKESDLRDQYEADQTKANNLDALKEDLTQIESLLKTLINRLPNKNEIPDLVINVSQAAIGNGLQVDLFEPQDETKKDFYAEKRINVKFRGTYHQLGSFFSDVAKQPRLVSVVIDGMKVNVVDPTKLAAKSTTPPPVMDSDNPPPVQLSFEGTVRTYRYLSEDEEAELAKAQADAEKAKKKKAKPTAAAKPAAAEGGK